MGVKWRGKPVFIRHRGQGEIDSARAVDVNTLRDPETDEERVKDPAWLVTLEDTSAHAMVLTTTHRAESAKAQPQRTSQFLATIWTWITTIFSSVNQLQVQVLSPQ